MTGVWLSYWLLLNWILFDCLWIDCFLIGLSIVWLIVVELNVVWLFVDRPCLIVDWLDCLLSDWMLLESLLLDCCWINCCWNVVSHFKSAMVQKTAMNCENPLSYFWNSSAISWLPKIIILDQKKTFQPHQGEIMSTPKEKTWNFVYFKNNLKIKKISQNSWSLSLTMNGQSFINTMIKSTTLTESKKQSIRQ